MNTLALNIAIYRLCARKARLSKSTMNRPFVVHDSVYDSAIPHRHTLAGTLAVPGACGRAVGMVYDTIWNSPPVLYWQALRKQEGHVSPESTGQFGLHDSLNIGPSPSTRAATTPFPGQGMMRAAVVYVSLNYATVYVCRNAYHR